MSFAVTGQELKLHNEEIVKCITELKSQRSELNVLIEKQLEEKVKLQTELQRISYKLSLVSRGLAQRLTTRMNYDRTIQQAEDNYIRLVETSGMLLSSVQRDVGQLEQIMDKRTGTEDFAELLLSDDSSLTPLPLVNEKSGSSEAERGSTEVQRGSTEAERSLRALDLDDNDFEKFSNRSSH